MLVKFENGKAVRCARCLRKLDWKLVETGDMEEQIEITPCRYHPLAGALYAFEGFEQVNLEAARESSRRRGLE
jgi:hypothetical protein